MIKPKPYKLSNYKERICTFDIETDPFKYRRAPKPFACGLYYTDTDKYIDFWGDNCIEKFFNYLAENHKPDELRIFAHNGGMFDFMFFLDKFDDQFKPFIINSRLVEIKAGGQFFHDSFAMIPVPLGQYDKVQIDYSIMERENREENKKEILHYMQRDCTALGELVTAWISMFGKRKTMASAALAKLRELHGYETMTQKNDQTLRNFYFGGRVQCFETGIIKGPVKIFDVKSSYPDAMFHKNHPISATPIYGTSITDNTFFVYLNGKSKGALPMRKENGSLIFPNGQGDFFACIHEINSALELNLLTIDKIHYTIDFAHYTRFDQFINEFFTMRQSARDAGNKINELFYKLVMNSAYGKFGQNPDKFKKFVVNPYTMPTPVICPNCDGACATCISGETNPLGWEINTLTDTLIMYQKAEPIFDRNFINIATAASITSAARAKLLYAITNADRPIYCDTDSITCFDLKNVKIGENLGNWNLENTGDEFCAAGKKLYALFDKGVCIKKASKGAKLSGDEIKSIANGETICYQNDAPKLKVNGDAIFTQRLIRKTA
jgi:hypothetical protein